MKILANSITDPFVHVLAVGLLLVYLGMSVSREPKPRPDDATQCQTCNQLHADVEACPVPLPKTVVRLAAH